MRRSGSAFRGLESKDIEFNNTESFHAQNLSNGICGSIVWENSTALISRKVKIKVCFIIQI